MPSAKQPSAKPAAAIVNATAKTRSVIESLQARLTAEALHQAPEQTPEAPATPFAPNEPADDGAQPMDDLERELQAYFDIAAPKTGASQETPSSSRNELLNDLRNHVIDGVVDRILTEWGSQPSGLPRPGLAREVMDRLVERVLEEFRKSADSPKAGTL